MKLQTMEAGEVLSRTQVYRAADVDALLARIRAAVDAEREAEREEREQYAMWHIQVTRHGMKDPRSSPEDVNRAEQEACDARAALDALLADGGG